MECHKCVHQAAVEAGKFRGMAYEQTPCARCDGMNRESYPLQYQDLAVADGVQVPTASVPELAFPEEEETPVLPVSVLVAAMAAFFSLPDVELLIFRLRYRGASHVRIARELGSTKKAVEMRFARAMERWPELSVLFPVRGQHGSSKIEL